MGEEMQNRGDTQWPRYQVFQQERPGAPHQDVGSVHAPDPELALFNARDVFVRRPDCVSLWIVPAAAIISKTAEEIEAELDDLREKASINGEKKTYHIFCKTKSAGTATFHSSIDAANPENALLMALESQKGKKTAFVWWVVPADRVHETTGEDIESMFSPARDKPFRLSTDFHTHSFMRGIKKGKKEKE
jgi:ring-1,2-phenylacetyl-CoA epoxidase subunit PaaB